MGEDEKMRGFVQASQLTERGLLRLVVNQLLATKEILSILTNILCHDFTPEEYAAAVEEPGLLRVLSAMEESIDHLVYHELTNNGQIAPQLLAHLVAEVAALKERAL